MPHCNCRAPHEQKDSTTLRVAISWSGVHAVRCNTEEQYRSVGQNQPGHADRTALDDYVAFDAEANGVPTTVRDKGAWLMDFEP